MRASWCLIERGTFLEMFGKRGRVVEAIVAAHGEAASKHEG